MTARPTVADYKAEIAERLDRFARSLPKRIDGKALSRMKLPANAMWYRETMIWRFTELAQEALDNFNRKRFAAAIVLTRAAVETAAGLWYLRKKIKRAIEDKNVDDLYDLLLKLNLGSKDPAAKADFPEAVGTLTFVKHVEKEIEGFAHQYDVLCEYTHPNYLGAACLFSWPHARTGLIDFGANVRAAESHEFIGLLNLSVAAMMFEFSYRDFEKFMPALISLCEKGGTKK